MDHPVQWPDGKRFAFTIFDDPDSQSLECSRRVYGLLADLGFRTTKGIWPLPADPARASDRGLTCEREEYIAWLRKLQGRGFELGYHNATSHTSTRVEVAESLERFVRLFGRDPVTMSNHYHAHEAVYWGPERLSGWRRVLYDGVTRGRNRHKSFGHVQGDMRFWGDLCREKVRYVRNFVYRGINTLRACPYMPYHDVERPFVRFWYASSEGAEVRSFVNCIAEANQDRLEAEGGACIMYAHFGHGFLADGELHAGFRQLMMRLSRRPGWFVPAGEMLDYLRARNGGHRITQSERARLEKAWLWEKLRHGTS